MYEYEATKQSRRDAHNKVKDAFGLASPVTYANFTGVLGMKLNSNLVETVDKVDQPLEARLYLRQTLQELNAPVLSEEHLLLATEAILKDALGDGPFLIHLPEKLPAMDYGPGESGASRARRVEQYLLATSEQAALRELNAASALALALTNAKDAKARLNSMMHPAAWVEFVNQNLDTDVSWDYEDDHEGNVNITLEGVRMDESGELVNPVREFDVTFDIRASATVRVEADSESDAEEKAYEKLGVSEYDEVTVGYEHQSITISQVDMEYVEQA